MVVLYFFPIVIVVSVICIAHLGIKATEPIVEELPGSWDVKWFLWSGFIMYQSFLWGVHPLLLQSRNLLPTCSYNPTYPFTDDSPDAVWFPFNNYQSWYEQGCAWKQNGINFKVHAMTGPLILLLGCFNFFKFSRNVVFDIKWHRWVGRLHNVIIIVCGVSAAVLSTVTTTPMWIEFGFVILGLIWLPSCMLGWYFIYFERNIIQHKRFMTRCFSCTATAISLRLYKVLGGDATPYWVCVWVSLSQLPLVEYYLQQQDDCDRIFVQQFFYRYCFFKSTQSLQMPDGTVHSEAVTATHNPLSADHVCVSVTVD